MEKAGPRCASQRHARTNLDQNDGQVIRVLPAPVSEPAAACRAGAAGAVARRTSGSASRLCTAVRRRQERGAANFEGICRKLLLQQDPACPNNPISVSCKYCQLTRKEFYDSQKPAKEFSECVPSRGCVDDINAGVSKEKPTG